MHEVIDVAQHAGVPLKFELIDELMARIMAHGPIGSSMQRDCKSNYPMEIEVILGTPVRKGRQLGVSIPTLEIIYTLLLGINSRIVASRS